MFGSLNKWTCLLFNTIYLLPGKGSRECLHIARTAFVRAIPVSDTISTKKSITTMTSNNDDDNESSKLLCESNGRDRQWPGPEDCSSK